jgi:DNA-binding LacI/PurR family transcriptional regulator
MKKSKPIDRSDAQKLQIRQATGRTTIHDVAHAAAVSPMTISNYLNGRSHRMRPETRARIAAEIARLGYRPHSQARSLRTSKRLAVGMIIVDPLPNFLADPFITQVVAGLSNSINARGYALLLHGLPAEALHDSPLIKDNRTDGMCVMLSGSDGVRRSCLDTLLGLSQPLVLFQDTLRIKDADLCSIRQADRVGGRLVAGEVLAHGARQIVMLVPQLHWPAISERGKGVRDVIRKTSNAAMRLVRCGDAEFRDTQAALAVEIDKHGMPDAILAGNDQMGIAALKLVRARGHAVPKDVLVTGFNAFEFWQYTDPVLTTVRSSAYEIGTRGGVEMLHRFQRGTFALPEIVFPVELQRGESI